MAGEPQKVQPKVFDLLVFLIANRDRALSKEDIQDAIWPDVEVSETAMTRAIMKARKLLNDSGEIIKTVHGHGYHFIAEVNCQETPSEPQNHHRNSVQQRSPNKPLFYVLALLVIAALLTSLWLFRKTPVNPDEITVAVLPVMNQTNESDLAWAGMGLMSLANEMIKADHTVETVSSRQTAQIDVSAFPDDLNLSNTALEELRQDMDFTHLLLIKLTSDDGGMYQLVHTVYHPNGQGKFDAIKGDNPTAMVQKMVREFLAALPGRTNRMPYRSISEDVFTNELYSRGMGYQIMGDAKKAREYFQLAVNEDPSLFWPRYELALTTRKLGMAAESEQELLKLKAELHQLTDDPSAALVLANALGSAKMRQGDDEAARAYYEEGFEGAVKNQRYDYQVIMAGNVALMYKRMNQLDQAKSWVARSIAIQDQQKLEPNGYPHYLLGQIESMQGNNQEALQHFEQAISYYQQTNQQRLLSSTLSEKGKVFKRLGQWQKAEEIYQQSIDIKIKMSDRQGQIAGQLFLLELYTAAGQYEAAEALFAPTLAIMDEVGKRNSQQKYITRARIRLAHAQDEHQKVSNLLSSLPDKDFNRLMRLISLQTQVKLGNPIPLQEWLASYQQKLAKDEVSPTEQMMALDLQLALAESNGQDTTDLLVRKIQKASELGWLAVATSSRLELAELLIAQGDWNQVEALLQLISLENLDWWQIKLLEALLLHHQGQFEAAQEQANQAKNQSTDSWNAVNEKQYQAIVIGVESEGSESSFKN